MPTVLLNAGLSMVPDATLPVRSRDTIAVIAPMYNEEQGAARALNSLLRQTHPPDEVAISVNGCTDGTYAIVVSTLLEHGFERRPQAGAVAPPGALLEHWRHPDVATSVLVVTYTSQTAKSLSINNLSESALLHARRILIVDGDTVLSDDFIAKLRDSFYRLHLRRRNGKTRAMIEDVALQSGAVASYLPDGSGFDQRVISAARSAEYALSGMLRSGQTRRIGRHPLWGRSRLFTVVGCGFTVRRDLLPVPSDTLTEDHDLTLSGQTGEAHSEVLTLRALTDRGFRPVVDGVECSLEDLFDRDDEIELRHGNDASFVSEALMFTEDPPHLNGYLRQIERWNGGSIQNALKRVAVADGWRGTTANVRFAVVSAWVESLLGLLLLLALPVMLAINVANPSLGLPWRALAWWFGADVIAAVVLVGAGHWRAVRFLGKRGPAAVAETLRRMGRTIPPFMLLKYFNPVSYLAAASKVVPAFIRERVSVRRKSHTKSTGVSWDRPAARLTNTRTGGTAAAMSIALVLVFAVSYALVPRMDPAAADGWRLVYRSPVVLMSDHEHLPLMPPRLPNFEARTMAADTSVLRVSATSQGVGSAAPTFQVGAYDVLDRPPSEPSLAASDRRWGARISALEASEHRSLAVAPSRHLTLEAVVVHRRLPSSADPRSQGGDPDRAAYVAQDMTSDAAGDVLSNAAWGVPSPPVQDVLSDPVRDTPADQVRDTLADQVRDAPSYVAAERAPVEGIERSMSGYCSPDVVRRGSADLHALTGAAADYTPLSAFDRLMLARLAPLAPLIEAAATAYDLPATFLAQMLVNESYLDPLAVGATGDKGLSQMTSDALTMLAAFSNDPKSDLYNPELMSEPFSVFDPDFSICAGAAKLAWASDHAGGMGRKEAYALYINPIDGLTDGRVSDRHAASVNAMVATRPLLIRLGNAYAAYREDPSRLTDTDRELLDISRDFDTGAIDLAAAYRRSFQIVIRDDIDDRALYQAVLTRLYPDALAAVVNEGVNLVELSASSQ